MANQYQQYLADAKMAYASQRYSTAIVICDRLIQFGSKDTLPYKIKGNSLLLMGKYEDAKNTFDKLLELNDQDGESYYFLGNVYYAKQEYGNALKAYAGAEKYGVSNAIRHQMYAQMGAINSAAGQHENAIRNFEKANQIEGNFKDRDEILLSQLQLYVSSHDWENAEAYARQYKLLNPTDYYGYQVLFRALMIQQKFEEAAEVLNEAQTDFRSDETRIEIIFDMVSFYVTIAGSLEDKAQADIYYAKALKTFNQLDGIQLPLDVATEVRINKAELYMQLRQDKKAATLLEGVVTFDYGDDSVAYDEYIQRALYFLTRIYQKNGLYVKTINHAVNLLQNAEVIIVKADAILQNEKSGNPEWEMAKLNKHQAMRNKYHALYMIANSKLHLAEKKKIRPEEVKESYQYMIAYARDCAASSDTSLAISVEADMYCAKAYKDLGNSKEVEKIKARLPEEAQPNLERFLNEE